MEADALADRVVHVNARCGSLAEFIAGVLPIVHSADECRAVLDALEHEHDGDDAARRETARRLRLAEVGGLWPHGAPPPDAPAVCGEAAVVGSASTGPRSG